MYKSNDWIMHVQLKKYNVKIKHIFPIPLINIKFYSKSTTLFKYWHLIDMIF